MDRKRKPDEELKRDTDKKQRTAGEALLGAIVDITQQQFGSYGLRRTYATDNVQEWERKMQAERRRTAVARGRRMGQ